MLPPRRGVAWEMPDCGLKVTFVVPEPPEPPLPHASSRAEEPPPRSAAPAAERMAPVRKRLLSIEVGTSVSRDPVSGRPGIGTPVLLVDRVAWPSVGPDHTAVSSPGWVVGPR